MTERIALRKPQGLCWLFLRVVETDGNVAAGWLHWPTKTQVLSSVIMAEQPRTGTVGPQWHVSIVDRNDEQPARPSERQLALARCAFDMLVAEEDNHHPGAARHFWLPIDPSERVDCECKVDEQTIEEADGYTWTNPIDGTCRGCELEDVMRLAGTTKPCPIHAKVTDANAVVGG